jgi:hypothetical protein
MQEHAGGAQHSDFSYISAFNDRITTLEQHSHSLPNSGADMRLTQPTINNLALPPGKSDVIYFDDDVPGLGLRLRGGGKRWIFQYGIGSKQRRMTLGTAPALTLAAARKTAAELHARVRLGEDPAACKREGQRRASATIAFFIPQCLAICIAQALSQDHLVEWNSRLWAAS